MSVEREMSLAEWCAKLPSLHLVNQELSTLNTQLAALAEQNARLREALTACVCAMQDYQAGIGITDMFDRGERLGRNVLLTVEHPDLASPALNRMRAEGMEEAAKIANEHEGVAWAVSAIRNRKAELEKTNG